MLRSLLQKLPAGMQEALRRYRYSRQIGAQRFVSPEPEFRCLANWVKEGDWVLDVGANVGHYTCKMSSLVGATGRVFAFEPIPRSFRLLAANSRHFPFLNVTLINCGASDAAGVHGMAVPDANYYEAAITEGKADFLVYAIAIDSLKLPRRVSFVKIDAERHDLCVLKGMRELVVRDKPVLLVESRDGAINEFFSSLSYRCMKLDKSPNNIWLPTKTSTPE